MNEQKFDVLLEQTGEIMAENMPMDCVLLLVKAFFEEYEVPARVAGLTIVIKARKKGED